MAWTRQQAKILRAVIAALEPPPNVMISQWAGGANDDPTLAERWLPADEAAPGPWRNARTPYLVEPMDRLSPQDPARRVVLMKGVQLGGTELILNAMNYWICLDPGRIMIVQPNETAVRDFSLQRFAPMVALCPTLRRRFARRQSGSSNSVRLKTYPGGSVTFAGAEAPAGLRSKPIRYLGADEVDGYPRNAGGEGDPLLLVRQRLNNFPDSKEINVSTPKFRETSRIEAAFLEGDQRYYFVPCQHCGAEFVFTPEVFKIPQAPEGTPRHPVWGTKDPDAAGMACPECGTLHAETDKTALLAGGRWRPTSGSNRGGVPGQPCAETANDVRSFHLASFYSPEGWLTWAKIAKQWLAAQGDPVLLQAVINTLFGQTFDLTGGDYLDAGALEDRAEPFADVLPPGVGVITAGVDVQHDRVEVEIVGWGRAWESWSLAYLQIPGDPTGVELWQELDAALMHRFPQLGADGVIRERKIDAVCIDSSYEKDRVYTFCKPRWGRRVWAIKGRANTSEGDREIWPDAWFKAKRGAGGKYKVIGVDVAKRHIYARLAVREVGGGYCHFPAGRGFEYFKGLTSERRIERYVAGRIVERWEPTKGVRNEPLDLRVYAYAAAVGLASVGRSASDVLDLRLRTEGPQLPPEPAEAVIAAPAQPKAAARPVAPKKKPPAPTAQGRARGDRFIPDRDW